MKKVVIANEEMAEEVKRLIGMNHEVIIPVKGNSMLPFIQGDKDLAVLRPASHPLKKWDVVLAYDSRGVLLLHRIIHIAGDELILMGDGNLVGIETCRVSDVIAKLESVKRDDKVMYCNTGSARVKAVVWYFLRPLRRYLLFVYRKTILNNQ